MSKHVGTHALERAISQLAVGGTLNLDARRAAAGYDQFQEMTHQFQIPIGGTARNGWGWTEINVPFDVDFMFVPEQRDSPLAVPHFSAGPVVSVHPDAGGCVAVACNVVEWARDAASDAITGAVVAIGVTSGGADRPFSGYVHLTFQGFGLVTESSPSSQDPGLS